MREYWSTCILVVFEWDRKSSIETFILGPTYRCIHTSYIWIYPYIQHTALTAKQKCIVESHTCTMKKRREKKNEFQWNVTDLLICWNDEEEERERQRKKSWMEIHDKCTISNANCSLAKKTYHMSEYVWAKNKNNKIIGISTAMIW